MEKNLAIMDLIINLIDYEKDICKTEKHYVL